MTNINDLWLKIWRGRFRRTAVLWQ